MRLSSKCEPLFFDPLFVGDDFANVTIWSIPLLALLALLLLVHPFENRKKGAVLPKCSERESSPPASTSKMRLAWATDAEKPEGLVASSPQ